MKPSQRKPAASSAKSKTSPENPALDKVIEESAASIASVTKPAAAEVEAAAPVVAKTEAPAAAEAVSKPVVAAAKPVVKTVSPAPTPTAKVLPMSALPNAPFKGYDDLTAFSKANVDAFIQANQVLAKGFEAISKEMISLTQASMESAAAAAKAVFQAKTFKDVVELNTDYTKTSFDKFVSNSTKLSELSVKVATDAFAPVTARVNVAVEKILKPSA